MNRPQRHKVEKRFLAFARAVTVGVAYVCASPIPGLTSSFVAIFTALLPFDLIVASTHPPRRPKEWGRLVVELRPWILSTASTLLQGVALGAAIGILAVLGLPHVVGAVLTSGLAYAWSVNTPRVISTYVAVISGLALFERLAELDVVQTVRIVQEIGGAIASSGGGTFVALLVGWGVGILSGSVTRLFLSRSYRSLRSSAYELPIEKRPFDDVMRVGETTLLISLRVEAGAPVANRSLAETKLRDQWDTSVLLVRRSGEEIAVPSGSVVLHPGDDLLLLARKEHPPLLYEQFQTPSQTPAVNASS